MLDALKTCIVMLFHVELTKGISMKTQTEKAYDAARKIDPLVGFWEFDLELNCHGISLGWVTLEVVASVDRNQVEFYGVYVGNDDFQNYIDPVLLIDLISEEV